MDQIDKLNPPPNPAKLTDSRAQGYIDRYGNESWELDAIEPRALVKLIQREIEKHLDYDLWDEALSVEREHEKSIRKIASNWDKVEKYLRRIK